MSPARLARRLLTLAAASLALPALVAVAAPARADGTGGWTPKTPPLTTPWTSKVTTHPLPEYPRPQLTRPRWQNLNGVWQFAAATGADQPPPVGRDLAERILVPYPVESALSGIMRHEQRMWYRRTFTVPPSWRVGTGADRLLLHFGAVDHQATIWVNGVQVGSHQGGYDAFTVDVTAALHGHGPQELVVGAYDPTDGGDQPVGKQRNDPGGIFYTPTSGIWQTVWMEPTPALHIDRLDTTPDLVTNTLRLTVQASGAAGAGATVEATASAGGHVVGRATGRPGAEIRVPVPHATLWSPDHPFLYDLTVRLRSDRGTDQVGSYFGMRSIGLATGRDGMLRPVLNGRFVFQVGTLDQGFWPDGIYTAPTDDALRF
ncbi:MAG: glycoside hydrolase family 2 protein, partial [Mycobacteriales bacterium]